MIDAVAVLDPDLDVVRWAQVIPPSPPDQPLWSCAARLTADAGGAAQAFDLVGACSLTRSDAVVRAAGESVERYALRAAGPVATPAPEDLGIEPAAPWTTLDWTGWAPADAGAACYGALDLATGGRVEVPAVLVDDTDASAAVADLGPSGAAAGPDLDFAVRAAIYELVERDAVMAAWACQAGPRRLRPADVPAHLSPAAAQRWERVQALAATAGVEAEIGLLPTCLTGRPVVLVALTEPDGQVAAFGMKLGDRLDHGVLGASYEAFQLRAALRTRRPPAAAMVPVTSDADRADWLCSAAGRAAMAAWFAGWDGGGWCEAPPEPSLARVVDAVVADGGRPLVVDLSPRLPSRLRREWAVVRVLLPGFQPLRIDERRDWTWNRQRVRSWAERLGARASAPRWDVPHFMV